MSLWFVLFDLTSPRNSQVILQCDCFQSPNHGTYVALLVYRDCSDLVSNGFDTTGKGMVIRSNTVAFLDRIACPP